MPVRTLIAFSMLASVAFAARAEETDAQWVEYKSQDRGFAASFPTAPEATSAPVAGLNPLTRYSFRATRGDDAVYSIVVLEYPVGKGPKASIQNLFADMVAAYAKDSDSRIRKRGAKTLADRDGYEAILDDKSRGKLSHLVDLIPDGDRLYMVISAGPKNHADGDSAEQFRDSFRLLSDQAETGSTHPTTSSTP
jgi:hypothetical protein